MSVCKGRFVVWTQVASKTGEIARLSKESYGVTPDFFFDQDFDFEIGDAYAAENVRL